jgi:hypothetical protein
MKCVFEAVNTEMKCVFEAGNIEMQCVFEAGNTEMKCVFEAGRTEVKCVMCNPGPYTASPSPKPSNHLAENLAGCERSLREMKCVALRPQP